MYGFQAEGAAPIVRGHAIEKPETVATAIRIGNPASWQKAVAARDESGGIIDMVSDAEILAAQGDPGLGGGHLRRAGLGGAAGRPDQAARPRGGTSPRAVIVCVVTGNGLKDTETALKGAKPFLELPDDLAAVEKALGWT